MFYYQYIIKIYCGRNQNFEKHSFPEKFFAMLYLLKSIKIILYIRIGKINEKNTRKQRKNYVKNINDNKTDDFIQVKTLIYA